MIPGFEQAFGPLKGYRFANERSRTNALWLALWLQKAADTVKEPFRAPLVVITGPQKQTSSFAHKLCKSVGLRYSHSQPWPLKLEVMVGSIAKGIRAVICEKINGSPAAQGQRGGLATLISSPYLLLKEAGASSYTESIPIRTIVIVAAGEELSLPADLARRSVAIRLLKTARAKKAN